MATVSSSNHRPRPGDWMAPCWLAGTWSPSSGASMSGTRHYPEPDCRTPFTLYMGDVMLWVAARRVFDTAHDALLGVAPPLARRAAATVVLQLNAGRCALRSARGCL